MKSSKNKGGRPSKCSDDAKKSLVWKYYYHEVDSNKQALEVHNIYAKLSSYAQREGFNLVASDFSRSEAVRAMIKQICEEPTEITHTTTFKTLDIDYFLNERLSVAERKKRLVEINAYYLKKHQQASEVLKQFQFQKETISALQAECARLGLKTHELEEKIFPLSQKNRENVRLKEENAFLRSMIKTHITDPIVLSMIEEGKPTVSKADILITSEPKEPAMLDIRKFEKAPENTGITDIRNLLKKKREDIIYEKE